MTKIMLVEDDKSLREIYGVRLLAEGYDIVSAGDGEEALAVAIKERPALIVTDVMMPKISGFDMLDILRSTTETKNIKVIMMTALGSDDQRARGDQLGADRYLVKSQVGIEDVVRTVHEVLGDKAPSAPSLPPTPPPAAPPTNPGIPVPPRPQAPAAARVPAAPMPPQAQVQAPAPVPTPAPMPAPQPTPDPYAARQMAPQPSPQPPASATTQHPSVPVPGVPAPVSPHAQLTPAAPSTRNRVIQPLTDVSAAKVNINELLDRELAREAGIDVDNRPPVASAAQEKAVIQDQLATFSAAPTATSTPAPATPQSPEPTIQIDSDGRVSMPPVPGAAPSNPGTPPPPPPPVR